MSAGLRGVTLYLLVPQRAEAPKQAGQDEAEDYGLNGQQWGRLRKGRDITGQAFRGLNEPPRSVVCNRDTMLPKQKGSG